MKLPSDYLAEGWCQGVSGRDANGKEASYETATSWCFNGASSKAFGFTPSLTKFLALAEDLVSEDEGCRWTATWNDELSRTQEEVVTLARRVEVLMGLTDRGILGLLWWPD